jgi:hypothetical protein
MSNAGGMSTVTRYTDMLAGNAVWSPWEPEGAYDSLATVTVPSGGLASITFAAIPNTYKHLQIRAIGKDNRDPSNADSPVFITFNGDTAANYSAHELRGNGSTTGSFAAANTTQIIAYWNSNSTNIFGAFVADILDYADTNKNKTLRSLGGNDRNGTGLVTLTSGAWRNNAAITSVTISAFSSPIQQYSQVSLYGVK